MQRIDQPQLPIDENGWVTVCHKTKKTIDRDKNKKTIDRAKNLQDGDAFRKRDNKTFEKQRNNVKPKQEKISVTNTAEKERKSIKQKHPVTRTSEIDVKQLEIASETKPSTGQRKVKFINDASYNGLKKKTDPLSQKEKIVNDTETEERKKLKQAKKQIKNEEKKARKEEKARKMKENLRKDPKVKCISQDFMNSLSGSNAGNTRSSNNITYQFQSTKKNFDSIVEYPSLNNTNSYRRLNHSNASRQPYPCIQNSAETVRKSSKNVKTNVETVIKSSKNVKVSATRPSSSTENSISRDEELSHNLETKKSVNTDISSCSVVEVDEQDYSILTESPTKKNVKTKDPITLDITDFIKVTKKDIKQEKIKAQATSVPVKVERKGKITEGKKKKLSTLKKNIQRQKLLHKNNCSDPVLKTEIETDQNDVNLPTQHEPLIDVSENKENLNEPNCAQISDVDNEICKTRAIEAVFKEVDDNQNVNKATHRKVNCLPNSNSEIKPVNISQEFVSDLKKVEFRIHTRKFRGYCDHVITPEINEALEEFLEPLVMFQSRAFSQDPVKAKMKRRYYCGLKEALKHMKRTTCIIMVPNLKPSPGPGCIDELVNKVRTAASDAGVPVIFGLNYVRLGKICRKKVPVSCINILNNGIQGIQDKYGKLLDLIPPAKRKYEELVASVTEESSSTETTLKEEAEEVKNLASEVCQKQESSVTDSLLQALKS